MSLVLELEPDVENALRDHAAAEGLSISALLARTFPPRTVQQRNGNGDGGGDARTRVQALLTKWQEADQTPVAEPAPNDGTMTPSEALFRKWEQEDAAFENTKDADLRSS